MPRERRGLSDDAIRALWRLVVVVVAVGVVLTALVIVIAAHEHGPVSEDRVLANATGYGTFLAPTQTSLIFTFSCVRADAGGRSLPAGPYQVPSVDLRFDVAISRGAGRSPAIESVTLRQFLADEQSSAFHAYVERSPTRDVVTDAPGTTGCAGTITGDGGAT
jgi:hypothetical protein